MHGKASWNWRIKFPLELDSFMQHQRLQLQIWDRDITPDDCGGYMQEEGPSRERTHVKSASSLIPILRTVSDPAWASSIAATEISPC